MQVKLKDLLIFDHCYTDSFNRLNEIKEQIQGKWFDVDTKHLFNDQYNVIIDGQAYRIEDKYISAVKDDARVGMGRCLNCDKTIKFGEAEAHFAECEKDCCEFDKDGHITKVKDAACPYIERVRKNERTSVKDEAGYHYTKKIITTTWDAEYNVCRHKATLTSSGGWCKHELCRCHGIKWFMPNNTFFLRYPNGLPEQMDLPEKEVDICDKYRLEKWPYDNFYLLRSPRRHICFIRVNGKYDDNIPDLLSFSRDKLNKLPDRVKRKLDKFFEKLESGELKPKTEQQ